MDFGQISDLRIPGISSNKDELSYQVMFFEFFVRNVDPKIFPGVYNSYFQISIE